MRNFRYWLAAILFVAQCKLEEWHERKVAEWAERWPQ